MDRIGSVLLQFPHEGLRDDEDYDTEARAHVRKLNQLRTNEPALLTTHAPGLLQHVDPAFNTISYAYLLEAIYHSDSKISELPTDLAECTARFLLTFDERQIRYAGSPLTSILNVLHDGHAFPHSVAVELLAAVLERLDPTGSMFTSHHLPFLNQAYQSQNIQYVLPIVSKSIVFYPSMRGATETRPLCDVRLPPSAYISIESGLTARVTSSDVMQYDLICGLIHLGQRDFTAASAAFERVCTYPTRDGGCSTIMTQAYNKWILVNLILSGKARPLSSMGAVSAPVQRNFQSLSKPYLALAKAFEKGAAECGAEELKKEIEDGSSFWAEDMNIGLVQEVQQHYQRHHILRLREVYTKIGLEDIRTLTHSAETGGPLSSTAEIESLLNQMISTNLLAGILEKSSSPGSDGQGQKQQQHLTFLPEGEELTEAQFAAEIAASTRRIRDLEPIVKATDERLATSRDYVRHLVKEQKKAAAIASGTHSSGLGGGYGHDVVLDDDGDWQVEDEDLMTGVQAGGGLGDFSGGTNHAD